MISGIIVQNFLERKQLKQKSKNENKKQVKKRSIEHVLQMLVIFFNK